MWQAQVCWDDAMAESLCATPTTEYYYRRTFTTRDQVYAGVATGSKTSTTAAKSNRQQLAHGPIGASA